jgi:hypothetical protein
MPFWILGRLADLASVLFTFLNSLDLGVLGEEFFLNLGVVGASSTCLGSFGFLGFLGVSYAFGGFSFLLTVKDFVELVAQRATGVDFGASGVDSGVDGVNSGAGVACFCAGVAFARDCLAFGLELPAALTAFPAFCFVRTSF